jgi:hypothetical protein
MCTKLSKLLPCSVCGAPEMREDCGDEDCPICANWYCSSCGYSSSGEDFI